MVATARTIAICGGGACGLAVLLCLLQEAHDNRSIQTILIFEKESHVGPGLAYSRKCQDTIINMRADTMGLFADDPLHFSRWMNKRQELTSENQYPPREVYGEYLRTLFKDALCDASSKEIDVRVIQHDIVSLSPSLIGFSLIDGCGQFWSVDNIILALGNFTACTYKEFLPNSNYFASPWPLERLHPIASDSDVGILGSRLSAIDTALYLVSNGHRGHIYLLSRGGRLPTVQPLRVTGPYKHLYALHLLTKDMENLQPGREAMSVLLQKLDTMIQEAGVTNWTEFLQLGDPIQKLSVDIQDAKSGCIYWRSLADYAAPMLEFYWNALSEDEQLLFMARWNSTWYAFVHAMPLPNAEKLFQLLQTGQIKVLNVDQVHARGCGFAIETSEHSKCLDVDYLVEASGVETNVRNIQSPLIIQLLSDGLLEAHPAGGFCVQRDSLEATTHKGLYVIGSLTSGVHFYTNGIDRNTAHAARIAKHALGKSIFLSSHVAIILTKSSSAWTQRVLSIVPKMLKSGLVPFIYQNLKLCSEQSNGNLVLQEVAKDELDQEAKPVVRTLDRIKKDDDSIAEVDLHTLCTDYGLLLTQLKLDEHIPDTLQAHHIDAVLLQRTTATGGISLGLIFHEAPELSNAYFEAFTRVSVGDECDDPGSLRTSSSRIDITDRIDHCKRELGDIFLRSSNS